MAGEDNLKVEIIEGIEVYRIDDELTSTGGYDEVDAVDEDAARKRKESGWWGDQRHNYSYLLNPNDLKLTLYEKALQANPYLTINPLDSPGVYMYVNKADNGRVYIGSACSQAIFERQKQHLCSASRSGQQKGRFHSVLSKYYNAENWIFCALSMQGASHEQILGKERELILQYKSIYPQFGYNTQLPGGRN